MELFRSSPVFCAIFFPFFVLISECHDNSGKNKTTEKWAEKISMKNDAKETKNMSTKNRAGKKPRNNDPEKPIFFCLFVLFAK